MGDLEVTVSLSLSHVAVTGVSALAAWIRSCRSVPCATRTALLLLFVAFVLVAAACVLCLPVLPRRFRHHRLPSVGSMQSKTTVLVPDSSITVFSLKSLLEQQTEVALPHTHQLILHKGRVLQDWLTLEKAGVLPGDVVILTRV